MLKTNVDSQCLQNFMLAKWVMMICNVITKLAVTIPVHPEDAYVSIITKHTKSDPLQLSHKVIY